MTQADDRLLSVHRWYDATPDVVFEAFTSAQWLRRWFCPSSDVTVSVTHLDLRVGGGYRFLFRFPGDRVAVVIGEYRAVDPPRRLVFTWTWEPPDPHAGVETLVTVEFIAKAGGTELTLSHERFPSDALMRQHESGWGATLDRLAPLLRAMDCNAALHASKDAVEQMGRLADATGSAWSVPRALGKWSPSQIVEHVALSLEESAKAAAGHPSKFPRFPSMLHPLVRVLFFRRVLKKSAFPKARTNKAMDPPSGPSTPSEGRHRLEAAHRVFDAACRQLASRGDMMKTTIFGAVPVADYVRFMELHTRHHGRQMTDVAKPGAGFARHPSENGSGAHEPRSSISASSR